MGNANRLSRRLNWKVGVENDNENIKKVREKNDKIAKVVKKRYMYQRMKS